MTTQIGTLLFTLTWIAIRPTFSMAEGCYKPETPCSIVRNNRPIGTNRTVTVESGPMVTRENVVLAEGSVAVMFYDVNKVKLAQCECQYPDDANSNNAVAPKK